MNDSIKNTSKNKLIDILIGIALCAFSIMAFIFSFSIEQKARMFPVFISLALVIFSGLIFIRNMYYFTRIGEKKPAKTSVDDSGETDRIVKSVQKDFRPLIISGLCIIFVLLFPVIGFEISAFLLIFFTMAIIDLKEAICKIYIAIIAPAVLIAIFYYGLKLRIPLLFDNIFGK